MKTFILACSTVASLAGCASQIAARDCENMGYSPGTQEFSRCAERQVAAKRAAFMEMQRQKNEIAVQCEKSSQGIFGRNTGRSDCPR